MASPTNSGERAENNWEFHLRSLSSNARDSSTAADPAADPYILQSVKKIYDICKEGGSEDLVARSYPHINKIFQRCISALSQSRTSNGVLLLTVLQFFIDFGEVVLHDSEPSLSAFFRSCLSREFADPIVAEATMNFLNLNKEKLLGSFPTVIPQFFPLLLKLIAWNGERLEQTFLAILHTMISTGSFLPVFTSLVDLPLLVVALEKVERSSGSLVGGSIATVQKSAAPEMLLALMDEAYTGSAIEDPEADSRADDNSSIDVTDPVFLDFLKDENDGLTNRQWSSPVVAAILQTAISNLQSERLSKALLMTPRLLNLYFAIALHDVSDSLMCALIPLVMSRYATLFPDKVFSFEVTKKFSDFMLSAFLKSPNFIVLLKKPITDRLGEAYDHPAKTELALNLCWAVGEHGAGGIAYKDVARELFECLELLLYENLSRLVPGQESAVDSNHAASRRSLHARLLCFVVSAIAKLATCHRDLLPRAKVSLAKVARSRNADKRVLRHACDYLGLMTEPAICLSILGPSRQTKGPGIVNWNEGGTKMIAHIPFYLLAEQEGPPFHDFSFSDILPER